MDLQQAWKALQKEKFSHTKINKDMILQAIQQESHSTMQQLKRNLGGKLLWIIFFTVSTIATMLYHVERTELLMILSLPLLYFLSGLLVIGGRYQSLGKQVDFTEQALPFMKAYERTIRAALRFETVASLIFYPIAAITGICIGRHFKGIALADIFQDPKMLLFMLVAIVVLTPLGHFAAKSMNQKAFGGLLAQLKDNIRKLEDLD